MALLGLPDVIAEVTLLGNKVSVNTTDIAAIQTKNSQQDTEINNLKTRVTALETARPRRIRKSQLSNRAPPPLKIKTRLKTRKLRRSKPGQPPLNRKIQRRIRRSPRSPIARRPSRPRTPARIKRSLRSKGDRRLSSRRWPRRSPKIMSKISGSPRRKLKSMPLRSGTPIKTLTFKIWKIAFRRWKINQLVKIRWWAPWPDRSIRSSGPVQSLNEKFKTHCTPWDWRRCIFQLLKTYHCTLF